MRPAVVLYRNRLATDGRLLSVDYVNDPLDLRLQSSTIEGVPDQIVAALADCIAGWVLKHTRLHFRSAREPASWPGCSFSGRSR